METTLSERTSWLDRPLLSKLVLSAEVVLIVLILGVATVSRFYDLGVRSMSHDENSHVYYSWRFYKGFGFAHDPLMHGPLQFHLLALSYFMFGDNDFTGRLPQALFSIAAVAFCWYWRRYLGRTGAVIAAVLMTISPYMLFYGRYARNEAFIELFGVVMLWGILRYLETGQDRYSYAVVAATVLHFTAKETSFIYTAQALIFLALYLVYRLFRHTWRVPGRKRAFLFALIAGLVLAGGAGGSLMASRRAGELNPGTISAPSVPGQGLAQLPASGSNVLLITLVVLAVVAFLVTAFLAITGYGWDRLRRDRAFGLAILLGTLVLPQLAAFPVRFVGWKVPVNATEVNALTQVDMLHIAAFLVPLAILSVVIGVLWNSRLWLINAAIWYAIFIVFYTSVFTNGAGFFTGIVGSLGYWLEQQGVNRGSQPWYYYLLVQVPVYEYLPALASLLAAGMLLFRRKPSNESPETVPDSQEGPVDESSDGEFSSAAIGKPEHESPPTQMLLLFWAVTALLAYSYAGEKMPWLTVHITLPMILLGGWALGKLVESIDWSMFRVRRGWILLAVLAVFLVSFWMTVGTMLGPNPPFQGKSLDELRNTSTFLTALITTLATGIGLFYLIRPWPAAQFTRLVTLAVFTLMAVLTARTAYQASFINYDYANELLVYAHMTDGIKDSLAQVEELSRRAYGGLNMPVAYDNDTSYPLLWYLRNYTDARYFGANPTRSLRDAPAIFVGDANYDKMEPVVGQSYYQFEYMRIWWPNQDYFNLTWDRVVDSLLDPKMRGALFQIWLNRDYTEYGQVTGKDMSLTNWQPSQRMRLYIRKDIMAKVWNYGGETSAAAVQTDPYEKKEVKLSADRIVGQPGTEAGQFTHPRGIAVAADGSLYVTDTDNHRVQHLSADGQVLQTWGTFADASKGDAPGGTFNQPWGIALGPDGSVYVADTWNHRVEKFTADGKFLKMWGYFGQAEKPDAFWGPRGLAVDSQGRLYVTDTGNKRVVVFDGDGNFVTQFGSTGMEPGQFDEPVGIAVDPEGRVYVADTWNQRIQVFSEREDGSFGVDSSWAVVGWFGQSLDNKPYLAVDGRGHVFTSDPEGYRILEFTDKGEIVQWWGDFGTGPDSFGIAASVGVDPQGGVWAVDAGNSRLLHFILP